MKEIKEANIFETENVALASFLIFEGIKLLECKMHDFKKIVVLRFLDEKNNILDLQQIFLNSEFKRYHDIQKYVLKLVHEKLKGD